ncbi:hypothetical protein BV25DRAFT_1099375 [Artomyces pyxidatus]|uniref:Uncharacterized protein n=1 Tax=Artomyces pyxidatus TaxID=48021 RepID=A0ACB8TG88_9AGAM|nr:hypothetical protein BV25DRAFT_1099375 [Artomyces pyxidatus]
MSFFHRRRSHYPDLDVSPAPSTHAPSSLRKRVSVFASKLSLRPTRSPSKAALSNVALWSERSLSRSPSPPSPDIRRPSGLGRRASLISLTTSPKSPRFPTRARTISSPNLLQIAPAPSRPRPMSLISLSLIFTHLPRNALPTLARVSKDFRTAALAELYGTLDLSPPLPLDAVDRCIARLAFNRILAALVRTLVLPVFPHTSASFSVALGLAINNMPQLSSLTLPMFDVDIVHGLAGSLQSLTLLSETVPDALYTSFLPSQDALTHLALPNLVSPPLSLPPETLSKLSSLIAPPALAMSLAPGRTLACVSLHVESTLYDGLRPAALMDALEGVRELRMILSRGVDTRTRARLVGALGRVGPRLRLLEIRMEGTSDETLYKQISGLLPVTPALRVLRFITTPSIFEVPSSPLSPPHTPTSLSSPPPSPIPAPVHLADSPGPPPFLLLPPSPRSPHPSVSTVPSTPDDTKCTRNESDAETDLREKTQLAAWMRLAPETSLKLVEFLSGSKWTRSQTGWAKSQSEDA